MKNNVIIRLLEGASIVERQGLHLIELPPSIYRPPVALRDTTPAMLSAAESLLHGSPTSSSLMSAVLRHDGAVGAGKWHRIVEILWRMAMIRQTLMFNQEPVATLTPISLSFHYTFREIDLEKEYVLSRFAYIHAVDGEMRLECPLGHAELLLHHPDSVAMIGHLAKPHSARDLSEKLQLDTETIQMMINFLLNLNAIDDSSATDSDPVLDPWEFHDLIFHSRSRLGRHSRPYGGTYPFKNILPDLPVIKPAMEGEVIMLLPPNISDIQRNDKSFTEVLESRASVRSQGTAPICLSQLSEFLYRTSRIKRLSADSTVCFRPSPGGGALHELEVYPIISHCEGLEPGAYHYRAADHALTFISGMKPAIKTLLDVAGVTATLQKHPQVFFGITARFQRVQLKYQSIAYSVILKNVGALYQTMYLVGTAMNLAPCALGGGHSDLFAQALGLNYYQETSVGEFVLGSRGSNNDQKYK
jgi:SagB-type dehydrogenase family enzyme